MAIVDLDLFRKHVRADDFEEDDIYLGHLLNAAEEAVIRATNRNQQELMEIGGGVMPTPIIQAIMMLGAHWYNQRESVSTVQMHSVPDALKSLIKQYRRLGE